MLKAIQYLLRVHESKDLIWSHSIEECGGLRAIELLQNHDNEEIYHLAYDIVDEFFSPNEVEIANKNR